MIYEDNVQRLITEVLEERLDRRNEVRRMMCLAMLVYEEGMVECDYIGGFLDFMSCFPRSLALDISILCLFKRQCLGVQELRDRLHFTVPGHKGLGRFWFPT